MDWPLNPPNRVRIRHVPGQRVTYLENPKVATRTIESSMWETHAPGTAPDNPHAEPDRAPFLSAEAMVIEPGLSALLATEFFTVVRNPYARFLSAYIDKVWMGGWPQTSTQFGFTPDVQPPAAGLLRAMLDLDPATMNPHFRPQHLTVFHGLAPLDHVGHMERMDDTFAWMTERGVPGRDAPRPYATGADSLVADRLDDEALALVRKLYAEDFARFGYSEDPAVLAPVRPAEPGEGSRERLRAALSAAA